MIKQIAIFVISAGLALALLKVFGGDPFAIIEWAIEWIWHLILKVRDLFLGSETFKEVTKKPK